MISPPTGAGPRSKKRDVGVPKFLRSLFEMLETEDTQIISWTLDGSSVQVLDRHTLENRILPKYFKHSKFTSFQRQLNYFGFKKNTKFRSHMYTFTHPCFRQNRKDLLAKITRHYGHDDDGANGGNGGSGDEDSMDKFLNGEGGGLRGDDPPFSLDPMLHLNSQDLDTLMCLMDPDTPSHESPSILPEAIPLRIQVPSPSSKPLQRFIAIPDTPPCMSYSNEQPSRHTSTLPPLPPMPVSPPSNLCFSPFSSLPSYSSALPHASRIDTTTLSTTASQPPCRPTWQHDLPHSYSHRPMHQEHNQPPLHRRRLPASSPSSSAPAQKPHASFDSADPTNHRHTSSQEQPRRDPQHHHMQRHQAAKYSSSSASTLAHLPPPEEYGVLYEAASMFL